MRARTKRTVLVTCAGRDGVAPANARHPNVMARQGRTTCGVKASMRLRHCTKGFLMHHRSYFALAVVLTACAADAASVPSDTWTLHTGEFQVEPGKERYLCYAKTLEEDVVVDGYRSAAQPFVHHLVLARTLAPEPDGLSECDTLFRMTWDPLYIAGAGSSALDFPSGAGHNLTRGTQVVLQMHLLNSSDALVRGSVGVDFHRSGSADLRPVNTYIFGTTDLHLPPNQASEAHSTCVMPEPVQLIAGFPHMHRLGRSLRFERGPSADALQQVFARDPYSFDDQHIENVAIDLAPGDVTRVTCAFENDQPRVVGFGESTDDEMCLFIGFALDQREIKSCATRPR